MTTMRADGMAGLDPRFIVLGLSLLTLIVTFTMPLYAFTVDEAIYVEMARAMAEKGTLSLSPNNTVADAPTIMRTVTHDVGGEAMPQYPSGYALIAAPFYSVLGVRGLMLLNAISTIVAVILTYRIGRQLYPSPSIALFGTLLFAGACFVSTYAFAIWPHMLSLAIVLASIERLTAAAALKGRAAWIAYATAGLALGAALNIRADVILVIIVALIWIRLFAAPGKRSFAVLFLAGLIPGLLIAATLNNIKFGLFSPIAYGPVEADDIKARYMLQYIALGVVLPPLMLLDFSRSWVTYVTDTLRRRSVLIGVLVAIPMAILVVPPLRALAWNIYVLVVDLQQVDPERFYGGMHYNTAGFITFWAVQKSALIQSLPFLPLMIIPVFAFLRKRDARAHALCFGMILGPVLFYSLTQWHGGYSLNMRYFLPALPFASLLCGYALQHLILHERVDAQRLRRILLVSGLAIFAASSVSMMFGLLPRILFVYYVPLLLAAGLLILLLVPRDIHSFPQYRLALTIGLGSSIAFAAVASIEDYGVLRDRLNQQAPFVNGYARDLPPGALVFTDIEEKMMGASLNNVHIAKFDWPERWVETAGAYERVGRCVYFHASPTDIEKVRSAGLDLAQPHLEGAPIYAQSIYILRSQTDACAPKYSPIP